MLTLKTASPDSQLRGWPVAAHPVKRQLEMKAIKLRKYFYARKKKPGG
jgi:hypothetical protein